MLHTKTIGASLIIIQELNDRGLSIVFDDYSVFIRSSNKVDVYEAKVIAHFIEIDSRRKISND